MKIGMFPMSGVRCCDPDLLEMGLTLPGFVDRNRTIASLPSLGLLTLAGMTPPEHEITFVEVPYEFPLAELPDEIDLAAISCHSAQIHEAYALAAHYRGLGIPTVIGGTHVSAEPEEASEHCDAVVIGEGECSWPRVLADAERGALKRFYCPGANDFDMREAPMPAFELLDISKYNRLTVQTSRGCPHRCEFCASSVLLSGHYKQKPIDKVVAEVDKICSLWKHPFIEFADDNSFVNRAYWRELLPHFKGRGIKWFAETDISVAEDGELLDLMRETGCAQLLIGLESPVAAGLDGLETRSNWKLKRLPQYKSNIRDIQSRGITVNGCFVLGLDGHTPAIFDLVYDFARELELYDVQATVLTAFPGTPLYKRLKRENRLLDAKNWKSCTLFDINFKPQFITSAELASGFKELIARLYSAESTAWRRERFKKLRHQRAANERSAATPLF